MYNILSHCLINRQDIWLRWSLQNWIALGQSIQFRYLHLSQIRRKYHWYFNRVRVRWKDEKLKAFYSNIYANFSLGWPVRMGWPISSGLGCFASTTQPVRLVSLARTGCIAWHLHSLVLLSSGRCGSGVERTLGFQPSCVRLPTCADAGGKAKVFVPSGLIGVM